MYTISGCHHMIVPTSAGTYIMCRDPNPGFGSLHARNGHWRPLRGILRWGCVGTMRKGVVVLMYVFIGCFQSVSNSIGRPCSRHALPPVVHVRWRAACTYDPARTVVQTISRRIPHLAKVDATHTRPAPAAHTPIYIAKVYRTGWATPSPGKLPRGGEAIEKKRKFESADFPVFTSPVTR
eukprot:COSAG03_NODE_2921_length_2352_cov_938.717960_3_plen_180_part_00